MPKTTDAALRRAYDERLIEERAHIMTTLAAIKKQILQLEKQAAEVRKADVAKAIATIKKLIADHELTADDLAFVGTSGTGKTLGSRSRRGKAKVKAAGRARGKSAPKYRDPKTGKTWTGVGKAPAWIVPATKKGTRDEFLIDAASAAVTAKAPAKPVAKVARAKKVAVRSTKKAVARSKTAKVTAAAKKIPLVKAKVSPKSAAPKKVVRKSARKIPVAVVKGPAAPTASAAT